MEGVWLVGVIDEIRMSEKGSGRNPILVDTKTRVRDSLPSKPQRRNGRYAYFTGFCFNATTMKIWNLSHG